MVELNQLILELATCIGAEPEIVEIAKIYPRPGTINETEVLDGIGDNVAGVVMLINAADMLIFAGHSADIKNYAKRFNSVSLVPQQGRPDAITHRYVSCRIALDGEPIIARAIELSDDSVAREVIRTMMSVFADKWPTKGNLLDAYSDAKLTPFRQVPASRVNGGKGWPATPNIEQNARVEQAAVDVVRSYFGHAGIDRQADNCGWDLEFTMRGTCYCVEVKGVSGAEPRAAISVNEYRAMQRVMSGNFTEGRYRLAVVTSALVDPTLHIFEYQNAMQWKCELTGKVLEAVERKAAVLSE